jgi:prenyltransferase beta subunit
MFRLSLVGLSVLVISAPVRGQTAAEKKATVAYLRGLQTASGGFLPAKVPPTSGRMVPPSLRATTAAVRALKYFGGTVQHKKAAVKFVRNCFVKSKGGFSNTQPVLQPDVISTAVGLMAVVELKMPPDRYTAPAVKYLDQSAKSFEEIRMAAAGLEAVHKRPGKAGDWLKEIARLRNADGTYGKGKGAARETGSAVVTVLRLGGKVKDRRQVLKTLRAGQRPDGGFGKADRAGSDLETCYRVLRAFVMLKAIPDDVKGLRKFIARCRNADGGYGLTPGQPSNVGATYFAATVLHWLAAK